MKYSELIISRESIRSYDSEKPVDTDTLKRIVNAGRIAPSASNKQPWRFVIVSSKEMLEKVRPCCKPSWFQNAPHILIAIGNKDEAWTRKYDNYNSIETDMTIAMDHMILAAEDEGVATCWIAAFKPEILYPAMNIKPNEIIFAITPLGYPEKSFSKSAKKDRKSLDEVMEII